MEQHSALTNCPADFLPFCSRQAIKKYIKANNSLGDVSDGIFTSRVNRAIQAGVEKGQFEQPKGEFPHIHFPSHCDVLDALLPVLASIVTRHRLLSTMPNSISRGFRHCKAREEGSLEARCCQERR
jgi:hypothetical protein